MAKAKRFSKGKHIYTKWGKNFKEVRKMKETPIPQQQKLQVKMDDDMALGKYANLGSISCTREEFFLDFISVPPGSKEAKVISRIITSPAHAKRFAMAMMDNVKRYEAQHGEIEIQNNAG